MSAAGNDATPRIVAPLGRWSTPEPEFRVFSYLRAQLRRDLLQVVAAPGDVATPLLFFLLVISLFPLGISPDPQALAPIAGGILWITALLATLLSLDGLFRRDYEDGSLEQMVLGVQPLFIGVLARLISFWLVTGLPLSLLSPLFGYLLGLPAAVVPTLMLSLLLGTPVLAAVGAVGAALTVGLGRAGLLLSLLVLPLFVPVLILGVGAIEIAGYGDPATAPLAWLAALLMLSLTTTPFAISFALRLGVER